MHSHSFYFTHIYLFLYFKNLNLIRSIHWLTMSDNSPIENDLYRRTTLRRYFLLCTRLLSAPIVSVRRRLLFSLRTNHRHYHQCHHLFYQVDYIDEFSQPHLQCVCVCVIIIITFVKFPP